MIVGTRHICDRCGGSIGDDRVTLRISQDAAEEDDRSRYYNGWIAHYHPPCYDDVCDRIEAAADQMPTPELDTVEALNSIPVIHENVLSGLRSRHRMPDGKTPAEAEGERYREGKARWRRMSVDERDTVILNAISDQVLALWPLLTELDRCCDVIVTSETLRAHLKSMTSRRLVDQDIEKPDRGRPRMCWRAPAAAHRTQLEETRGDA